MTTFNLAEILTDAFGSQSLEVTSKVSIDQLLDQYRLDEIDVDEPEFLAQHRQDAFIWSIDDVKEQRPDLADEQCWEVLKQCESDHGANTGMNLDVIDWVAFDLFGPAPETLQEDCYE